MKPGGANGDDRQLSPLGDRGTALAIGAVLFFIYGLGACRTIYVGDSGELVTAVHVLGVPHPTGYPLYVLLGKLWSLALPVESVAFRMSLFSTACAAVACATLFLTLARLRCDRAAALTAALVLAFSPSFWGEANVQRVYALNAAFVMLGTRAAVEWYLERSQGWFTAAMAVCALGAANHTFMAVFGVAFVAFALAIDWRQVARPRTLATSAIAVVAGLLPYAYLPIASSFDPPLDWGNPETWESFLAVVRREDFWGRAWLEAPADLLPIAADFLWSIGSELLWIGAAFAVVAALSRRYRQVAGLAGLVMLFNLLVMAAHGSRSDLFIWHRYYIPSYAMAALLLGCGVDLLARRAGAWALIALVLPLALYARGFDRFDRSDYRIAEDFSKRLLDTIPPGASLAASDDNILFVLMYLTMVEELRADVNLVLQGVGGAPLPALRFDPRSEPLYFTHHPNWDDSRLDVVPVGLAFRVWPRGEPLPPLPKPPVTLASADDPRVPRDYLTDNLVGHYYFMQGFTAERSDWLVASAFLRRAMREAPNNDVLFYNVGLIYQRNGMLAEALAAFRRSDEINPRPIPGPSRVRAADKIDEVEAELARLAPIEQRLRAEIGTSATAAGAEFHDGMATRLEALGEPNAARAHRHRARAARWRDQADQESFRFAR